MMKPAGGLRSLGGWEGHALPRQKRRGRAAEACRAASRHGGGTGLLSSSCRDRSARPLGLRSLSADRGSQYVGDNGDGEGAGRQEEVVAGSSAGLLRNWQVQVGAVVVALALVIWKVPALNAVAASSGFSSAFSLIFVSEIGDKTFFLAALLAAQKSKALVLAGAMGALSLMSVISVIIGYVFQKLPGFFNSSVPITEYASIVLLFLFGVQSLRDAFSQDAKDTTEEELEDAKETLRAEGNKDRSILSVILSTFAIIFVAEWGDRSMFATVALVASQNPVGVAVGSIAGHLVATLIAIAGGAMVSKHLSERVLKMAGGALFLMIGIATLAGVF